MRWKETRKVLFDDISNIEVVNTKHDNIVCLSFDSNTAAFGSCVLLSVDGVRWFCMAFANEHYIKKIIDDDASSYEVELTRKEHSLINECLERMMK